MTVTKASLERHVPQTSKNAQVSRAETKAFALKEWAGGSVTVYPAIGCFCKTVTKMVEKGFFAIKPTLIFEKRPLFR